MTIRYWLSLTAGLLGLMGTNIAMASDMLDGKDLFESNCAVCHGMDGTVSDAGKRLEPFPARNLRAVAPMVDRDELRRIITYGIKGTAMRPKKYELDALEIDTVIDYIQSFDYEPNLVNGKMRFEAVCVSCHGADGRAQTGVGAKNLVFSKLNLEGIIHTMRYGRPGTLMTSKRHQLSNADIADIANYVYGLRYKADAANGQRLYTKNCKTCHSTPSAIKIRGNAAVSRTIADLDDHMLDLRIRHGRHIDRAGKKVAALSADDVQDIIAYTREDSH